MVRHMEDRPSGRELLMQSAIWFALEESPRSPALPHDMALNQVPIGNLIRRHERFTDSRRMLWGTPPFDENKNPRKMPVPEDDLKVGHRVFLWSGGDGVSG